LHLSSRSTAFQSLGRQAHVCFHGDLLISTEGYLVSDASQSAEAISTAYQGLSSFEDVVSVLGMDELYNSFTGWLSDRIMQIDLDFHELQGNMKF
jgi:hypothetical protein